MIIQNFKHICSSKEHDCSLRDHDLDCFPREHGLGYSLNELLPWEVVLKPFLKTFLTISRNLI
jgi:hypothetical protein